MNDQTDEKIGMQTTTEDLVAHVRKWSLERAADKTISKEDARAILAEFYEWIANRRMKAIGLNPLYDIPANNNPLPWTDHWLNSKEVQPPPQEETLESYVVGGIKQDISPEDFKNFKL